MPLAEPSQAPLPLPDIVRCRYYPYVILGYGVAGQAALRALLERDPAARVLVVDARAEDPPSRSSTSSSPPSNRIAQDITPEKKAEPCVRRQGGPTVEFARGKKATTLDADRGLVTLASSQQTEGGVSPQEVAFGRCLLALGSRSRPPPPGFIDQSAWADVALLGSREGIDREGLGREVADGRSVTIVGSSWQALELACWLQEGRSVSGKVRLGERKGCDGQGGRGQACLALVIGWIGVTIYR